MPSESHMCSHRALQVYLVADLSLALEEYALSQPFTVHEEVLAALGYSPRSVLSKVSFASHTLNHPPRSSLSNSTTVRHAPLTAIESPI